MVTPVLKGVYSVPYAASALLADPSDSDTNDGVASNPGYSVSRAVAALVSGLTGSSRTYGISQHSPLVGWILIAVYILAVGVSSLRHRIFPV